MPELMLFDLLQRLNEISSALLHAAETPDLESVLDRIAHVARDLGGTKYAALGVPDGRGGLQYFRTAGLTDEQIRMIEHVPRGHGLLGAIMSERRVIRVENIAHDPRSAGFPPHHPPMVSFLGVPIQTGGQLFGMLYLCDKRDGSLFNEADEVLIQTLASYAALAIAGAQITRQARRIQGLEERERIGMALHDGVIQSLYGLGMQVQLLSLNERLHGSDLGGIIESLNHIIEDIRGFIAQLGTDDRPRQSVRQLLEKAVERLNPPGEISISIDAPDDVPALSPVAVESLLLILNEGLSNVIRHSGATKVQITAMIEVGWLTMSIQDDGRGFSPEEPGPREGGGLGLPNMKRRAQSLGGELRLKSSPARGTLLWLRIPLKH